MRATICRARVVQEYMIDTTARDSARPGARTEQRVGPSALPDFDEFVAARSTTLLRTAYLLTHDHALAEDLLQTSLTKAWFAWSRISDSPEAYVRKVLFHTYATWWRRKWNGEQATEDLPEPSRRDGGSGRDQAHATGAGLDLWTAMERLPRRQRAVVVLRYFEDLTEAQTAEVLGCTVGTVKSQCSRALAKLRI
ncbi:SigE family RNA polymerase sigma factor, partial [Nocardioides sp.]|uniref:SigE family RNA polymerase sigma factor n=1 Tax=Nocardioides sp. TaxID=35761 RepID=UPI002B26D9B8